MADLDIIEPPSDKAPASALGFWGTISLVSTAFLGGMFFAKWWEADRPLPNFHRRGKRKAPARHYGPKQEHHEVDDDDEE